MTNLPTWIYFNGTTYYLQEWQSTDADIEGWWFCGYWPDDKGNNIPPEVTDGYEHYRLTSCSPYDKEDAEEDLLDRINRMKPWLKN